MSTIVLRRDFTRRIIWRSWDGNLLWFWFRGSARNIMYGRIWELVWSRSTRNGSDRPQTVKNKTMSPEILFGGYCCHIWELSGNYPVFTMVLVIYYYVEKILRILVILNFCITYMIMKNIIRVNIINIHIQSFF